MINYDNIKFTKTGKNSIVQKILREVYGNDSPPEEILPFGLITKNDIENATKALKINSQNTFLDLACGTGEP